MQSKDHICVEHAICFHCFRLGAERTRARREAWAQRSLPFGQGTVEVNAREVEHRARMLAHLTRTARRA